MKCITLLFSLLFIVKWTYSFNILVMFPHPGKSHFLTFVGLFKALAQKGHNLTVISHFPLEEQIPNYRDIEIGGFEVFLKSGVLDKLDISKLDSKGRFNKYFVSLILAHVADLSCNVGLGSETVQNFLKENNHFDVFITESFITDCFLTVAKKLNAPVVRIHTCTLMPFTSHRFGNPDNPAYIPTNYLAYSDKMTFFERLENTFVTVIISAFFNTVVLKNDKRVSMKYLGEFGSTLDSDIMNDSLLLVAIHFTLNYPRPLVPNMIEIGGIHIGKPNALSKVRMIR